MSRLVRCGECEYWDPGAHLDDEAPPVARSLFGLCRANPPQRQVVASEKVVDAYDVGRLLRLPALPEAVRSALKAWWEEYKAGLPAEPRKFMRGAWDATHRMDGCGEGRRIIPGPGKPGGF